MIRQFQTIAQTLEKYKLKFSKQVDLLKGLKSSRNSSSRLNNYNSMTSFRKIKTSQTRLGGMTSRESNFRPTTGLGLVSETNYGSKTSHSTYKNSKSQTRIKNGFKFVHPTYTTPSLPVISDNQGQNDATMKTAYFKDIE